MSLPDRDAAGPDLPGLPGRDADRARRTDPPAYDAVVLAGGRGRRLGGVDKAEVAVGGRALLDRALDAAADADRVVVVGPVRPTRTPAASSAAGTGARVTTVQEDPPGGGPVAGLAAGVAALPAEDRPVLVLACDVPGAGAVVPALLAALAADARADVAMLVEVGGRRQPLVAAWRAAALRAALVDLPTVHGAAVHRLVADRRVAEVVDVAGHGADADTWDDVARLDRVYREEAAVTHGVDDAGHAPAGSVLHRWVLELGEELGVDLQALDIDLLLDLSRDVAHAVARPAVPLTTFLLGCAVASGGGDRAALETTAARVAELAEQWAATQRPTS